jgi:Protein of unknown function (DUF1549)/Protein of unknown function (DUF1553)
MKKIPILFITFAFGTQLMAEDKVQDIDKLKKAAHQIDLRIANFYKNKKLQVPPVTDDATFLRRAFLVAIGRVPSAEEALDFIEIDDADKREKLVAYLMNSKGYSSHMSNWAFDLLRIRDARQASQGTNEPYRHWVRMAINDNKPWNEFVRDLVAAKPGNEWDPKSANVGYYNSDRGMPLDNLANTMRVFLGSRMECAQCHDDPFGKTERKDFYHLAAFTNGQNPLSRPFNARKVHNKLGDTSEIGSPEFFLDRFIREGVLEMSLGGDGTGRIPLPHDYQYKDGDPHEVIGAKTPFGKQVRLSDREDKGGGREEFAEWIISKNGEQFPAVIANRMWQRIMGKGIYEPVDDYIEARQTVYPELVTDLARLMFDLKYDLRDFQHVLMLTKTFQFVTNPNASKLEGGDDFHGRKITRLSAEQIWDSLLTLSSGNPDNMPLRKPDYTIRVYGKDVRKGSMNLIELSEKLLSIQSEEEYTSYYSDLLSEYKGGSKTGNASSMSMAMTQAVNYDGNASVRASELPSPAPRNHLMYLFGASDREVVESASKDPNVGQVLSLMNGFVQKYLVSNPEADLYKSLRGVKSDEDKIRKLYITILNRIPTEDEMQAMLEEVKVAGDQGIRNIVSVLVMSSEFLFLQ